MKILLPVKNLISGIEIIKAKSDEIYFGIVSNGWEKKHGYTSILNRRDGKYANIGSYQDAKKLINFAKQNGVKSYITLNNSPIIDDYLEIKNEIKEIIKLNPDALIVKDIYIANIIREIDKNFPIHCSSLNQTLNSQAIEFWINNYSIERMIFPRNINIEEIKILCNKFPSLDFEIFIKNDWCYNSDGICSSLHLEGLKHGIPYICNREKNYTSKNNDFQKKFSKLNNNTLDCKICILRELKDVKNIVSLKIVGREKPLNIIINDLKFVKNSLKYLNLSETNKEYIDFNINLYKKIFSKKCDYKYCEIYKNNYK